jgi:hypothetical protein
MKKVEEYGAAVVLIMAWVIGGAFVLVGVGLVILGWGVFGYQLLVLASVWAVDAAGVVAGLDLAWVAMANSCQMAWGPKSHHLDFQSPLEF